MLFNYSFADGVDLNAIYSDINSKWTGVNAHYGKQGANVRLFGDKPVDRCEIWATKKGYDVFVGLETPLYTHANALLNSGWNVAYTGMKSKNEIALHGLTASDVTLLLKPFEVVAETKKEDSEPKTKRKSKARKTKDESVTA